MSKTPLSKSKSFNFSISDMFIVSCYFYIVIFLAVILLPIKQPIEPFSSILRQQNPFLRNHHLQNVYILLKVYPFILHIFISELNKNPVEGFSAGLIDDNDIFRWEVLIIGPPDTL